MTDTLMQNTGVAPDAAATVPEAATPNEVFRPLVAPAVAPEREGQIERQLDLQLEGVLYAGAWGPQIAAAIIKVYTATSTSDPRRAQQAQEGTVTAGPGKKKRGSSSFDVDEETASRLIAVLGPDVAVQVMAAIEKFSREVGQSGSVSPDQVAQMTRDLASALAGKESIERLSVSAKAVENFAAQGNDPLTTVQHFVSAIAEAAQLSRGAAISNPEMLNILSTPEGAVALGNLLQGLGNSKERIAFLADVKSRVGAEAFAVVLSAYSKSASEPIVHSLCRMADATPGAVQEVVLGCAGVLSKTEIEQGKISIATQSHVMQLALLQIEEEELQRVMSGALKNHHQVTVELGKALGIPELKDRVKPVTDTEVAAYLATKFPGLRGKSLEDSLIALQGVKAVKPESAQKVVAEMLGVKEHQIDTKVISEVQELAVGVLDALEKYKASSGGITSVRVRLSSGLESERAAVKSEFLSKLQLKPEQYPEEKILGAKISDAKLSFASLQHRIAAAEPEERGKLCAVRDQIEWQGVQARVERLLLGTPPSALEACAAIDQFIQRYPPGAGARDPAFLEVAVKQHAAISTVEQYVASLEAEREKLKSSAKIAQQELDRIEVELKNLKAEADTGYWISRGEAQLKAFNKYLNQDTRRLKQDATLQSLHILEKTAGKLIGASSAQLRQKLHRELLAGNTKTLSITPVEEVLRSSVLEAKKAPESLDLKIHSPFETTLSALEKSIRDASADLKTADLNAHQKTPPEVTGLFVAPLAVRPAATQVAHQQATNKVQEILTLLSSESISAEQMQSLRGVVSKSSDCGRILEAIPADLPAKEQIDLLLARTNVEDAHRIKCFLNVGTRSDVLESGLKALKGSEVATPFLPSVPLSDPSKTWQYLADLPDTVIIGQAGGGIAEVLTTAATAVKFAKVNDAVQSLSIAERVEFDRAYVRITGITVGEDLLRIRGEEDRTGLLLIQLSMSTAVTNQDLLPYFPVGTEIPRALKERAAALVQLLREGSKRVVSSDGISKVLLGSAEEKAKLELAVQFAAGQGNREILKEIYSRRAVIDSTVGEALGQLGKQVDQSYLRRTNIVRGLVEQHNQLVLAKQGDVYASAVAESEKLVDVLKDLSAVAKSDQPDEVLQSRNASAQQLVATMRAAALTESGAILQRVLYPQVAAQVVPDQKTRALTGSLEADIKDVVVGIPHEQRMAASLLSGGGASHRSYDLATLVQGSKDEDPRKLVTALGELHRNGGLPAALSEAAKLDPEFDSTFNKLATSDSTLGREISRYCKALEQGDTVTIEAIQLRRGVAFHSGDVHSTLTAVLDCRDAVGKDRLTQIQSVWKELYGTEMYKDLGTSAAGLAKAWRDILSSDSALEARGAAAIVRFAVESEDTKKAALVLPLCERLCANRAQVIAALNASVEGGSYLDFLRKRADQFAAEKADVFKLFIDGREAPFVSQSLVQLGVAEADTRKLQALLAEREKTLKAAQKYHIDFCEIHAKSEQDARARVFNRGLAAELAKANDFMRNRQANLISQQHQGIEALQGAIVAQRLTARVFSRDLAERGVSAIDPVQASQRITQRALAVDARVEWVAVRSSDLAQWQIRQGTLQRDLQSADGWATFGLAVTKAVVVGGLLFVPGIGFGLALGVATAWNITEKGVLLYQERISLTEAIIGGALEFTLDAVFLGFGAPAARGFLPKVGIWRVAVESPTGDTVVKWFFSRAAKDLAKGGWGHASDIVSDILMKGGGIQKFITTAAEKFIQNPANLFQSWAWGAKTYASIGLGDFAMTLAQTIQLLSKSSGTSTSTDPKKMHSWGTPGQGNPQVVQTTPTTIPAMGAGNNGLQAAQQNATGQNQNGPQQSPSPAQPVNGTLDLDTQQQIAAIEAAFQKAIDDALDALSKWFTKEPNQTPAVPPTGPSGGVGGLTPQPGPQNPPNPPPGNGPPGSGLSPAPAGAGTGNSYTNGAGNPQNAANQNGVGPTTSTPQDDTVPPRDPQLVAQQREAELTLARIDQAINGSSPRQLEDYALRVAALQSASILQQPFIGVPLKLQQPTPTMKDPLQQLNEDLLLSQTAAKKVEQSVAQARAESLKEASAQATAAASAVASTQAQSLAAAVAEAARVTLAGKEASTLTSKVPQMLTATAALVAEHPSATWQAMSAAEGEVNRQDKRRELARQAVTEQPHRESAILSTLQISEALSSTMTSARSVAEPQSTIAGIPASEAERATVSRGVFSQRNSEAQAELEVRTAALVGKEKEVLGEMKVKEIATALAKSAEEHRVTTNVEQQLLNGNHASVNSLRTDSALMGVVALKEYDDGRVSGSPMTAATMSEAKVSSAEYLPQKNTPLEHRLQRESAVVSRAQELEVGAMRTIEQEARRADAETQKVIQEEIRLHREITARLVVEEQSAIVTSEESRDRAEAARKAKAARSKRQMKADERLRNSIIHQLKTRQFQAAEQDKLMALLQRLGISQREYYALVAVLGELEAQRQAAGINGFQTPLALEVEEESTKNANDSQAGPVQGLVPDSREDMVDEVVVSTSEVAKKTTRGDLFARLRQAEE